MSGILPTDYSERQAAYKYLITPTRHRNFNKPGAHAQLLAI